MKNIENEYNKRFKNQEMDNSDFDVDGLWDAISEDLDGSSTPPNILPKGNPFLKYFGFGLLTLLLIGFGIRYLAQVDPTQSLATKTKAHPAQNQTQTTNTQRVTKENSVKNIDPNSLNQKQSTGPIISKKSNNNNSNTPIDISRKSKPIATAPSKSIAKISNITKVKNDLSRKSMTLRINNTNPQNSTPRVSDSSEIQPEDSNSNNSTNSIQNVASTTKGNIINPNTTNAPQKRNPALAAQRKNNTNPTVIDSQISNTKTIATNNPTSENTNSPNPERENFAINNTTKIKNPIQQTGQPNSDTDYISDSALPNNSNTPPITSDSTIVNTERKQLDSLASEDQIPTIKPTNPKNIHWQISLIGGTNKMFFNFKPANNLATLRNTNEKGTWGTSFGVNASMIWKNKSIISTGLEYHTLWSKLDYSRQTTRTQDSVLQEVIITQNGNIIAMTYDSLTRSFQNQITWNNQYKTYRIPLEVGYQKYINKWTIGAKAGAIFNITTSQKGKTFDNEHMVATFTQTDSFAPIKSFQIGFRISPFFGYQITDKMSLSFEPKWNLYKGQTADIQEFGINMGIGIRF